MPTPKLSAKTNKELLLLLNYRLEKLEEKVTSVCTSLEKKADAKDFEPMVVKINDLWDWRNKVVGMAIGVGAIAGGVAGAVVNALGGV